MQINSTINLMDVDVLVENFIKEREQSIATLHRIYFKSGNQISLRSLVEELKEELRTGCITFVNKESQLEELHNYLFYIANAVCKKLSKPFIKKKIEYLCPGCLYLGKDGLMTDINQIFQCDECEAELKFTTDPKKIAFFKIFHRHNKKGYHCSDCDRFIPLPIDGSAIISCPYFDCAFVGSIDDLRKMHHPTSQSNPEKLILDVSVNDKMSIKDNIPDSDIDIHSKLEIQQDLQDRIDILKDIIETQSNYVPYSSSDFTVQHKQLVYQAIGNLLDTYPTEMSSYLFGNADSHFGFQHKIFQEYIDLLEASFPYFITKNRQRYKVDNLLDDNLKLFDGISVFNGMVNEKMVIKNDTTEFYIGGRKGTVAKPYYIGKLLGILDVETKNSVMHLVTEYGFSNIKMHDIKPGTSVIVTHLRVPPHHQMNGMVYVNRVRKKIVERAKLIWNKDNV